jgi:hypothetical protein
MLVRTGRFPGSAYMIASSAKGKQHEEIKGTPPLAKR